MQTSYPSKPQIIVYRVQFYDIHKDEFVISTRMFTEDGAKKAGGKIVHGSKTLVDANVLEHGEDWTPKGFKPRNTD